jgi:hypothetical protein
MSTAAIRRSQEDDMGNDIPATQNRAPMLDLLRAKCALYDAVQRLYVVQAWATVGLPVVLSILKLLLFPALSEPAAVAGLLLLGADLGWLDPKQKQWRALAARAQEMFDVEVLSLPDHSARTGPALDAEAVGRWARKHPSPAGLRNWYPVAVGHLPVEFGRVVCQRANGAWNGIMRRRFAVAIRAAAGLIIAIVVIALLITRGAVWDLLTWLATLSPALSWAVRESKRQMESAEASDTVKERSSALWRALLAGAVTPEAALLESRTLQDDIHDQRRQDQQVFGWVYARFRSEQEEEMKVGAEALVGEYQRASARGGVRPSTD